MKILINNNLLIYMVVLFTLFSCSNDSDTALANSTYSGQVIDGYLDNAQVCLDINDNSICDLGEPNTTSNASGTFALDVPPGISASNYSLLVTAIGGTTVDEDGGVITNDFMMSAPKGETIVTPFTHLANTLIKNSLDTFIWGSTQEDLSINKTTSEAKTRIKEIFGFVSGDEVFGDLTQVATKKLYRYQQAIGKTMQTFGNSQTFAIAKLNSRSNIGIFKYLPETKNQIEQAKAIRGNYDDIVIEDIKGATQSLLTNIDISAATNGIVDFSTDALSKAKAPVTLTALFDKYTKVTAPNGKPIHIFIQSFDDGSNSRKDGLPTTTKMIDIQIMHVRRVLEFYLKNYDCSGSGLCYGSDKVNMVNAIANEQGFMALYNTEENKSTDLDDNIYATKVINIYRLGFEFQDLAGDEIIVVGSLQYMSGSSYTFRRDASFEEVIHFVHNYGINPVLTGMQTALKSSQAGVDVTFPESSYDYGVTNVLNHNPVYIYNPNYDDYFGIEGVATNIIEHYKSIDTNVNSEFLAYGIDAYYHIGAQQGQISKPSNAEGGNTREFDIIGRSDLETRLNSLYTIISKFVPSYLDFVVPMTDVGIINEGTFTMVFDANNPYTYNSQHIKDIEMFGTKTIFLIANDKDNNIIGSKGVNNIDGGAGIDTVSYPNNCADYTIQISPYLIYSVSSATDTFTNVERLKFKDQTIAYGAGCS